MVNDPASYRMRIKGLVGPEWSDWFEGMTITYDEQNNETILSGQLLDQAALYGILNKFQALGLPLLSVLHEAVPSSKPMIPPA